MLSPNTILQNRYCVVRKLGEGGMGAVYEAIDQRVSCVVALKETLVSDDGEMRFSFQREAALLANLRHPALPKVMDYFVDDEGQFLVMEYIPGHDLAELLELRGGSFPQDQVLHWTDELLKALEYLHSRQPPILHRDIKPAKIKLTKSGEIFLLDFGLAKGAAGQMTTLMTSKSVRAYTPVYSPLEQIHGRGTDQRSDLYALGATLYHMLTGQSPLDAPTRFAAVDDDLPDPLRSVNDLNPQVFPSVSDVVKQAMAIRRRGRFGDATAMRTALHKAREQWLEADEQRRKLEAAAQAAGLDRETQLRRDAERRKREESERAEEELKRRQAEEDQQRLAELLREREERARREEEEIHEMIVGSERAKREEDDSELMRPAFKDNRRPGVTQPSQPPPARVLAPTVPGPSAPETNRAEPAEAPAQRPPPMKTVHVSRPEMQPAPSGSDEVNRSTPPFEPIGQPGTLRDRRVFVIFGVVAAVVVLGILIVTGFYLWLSKGAQSSSANPAQPLTQSPPGISSSPPHPAAPDGMVYIPGGEFTMGRDDGDEYERPAHQVAVKHFFIDIHEVTNREYQEFVNQTGHNAPEHWANKRFPDGKGQLPVTNVNWDDANAYAKWAGKRLPTEAEWEFAARGTDGRRYPWGNDWQEGLANAGKKIYLVAGVEDLADVGSHKGASPYGLLDTVGNAWEWTADEFSAYPGGQVPEQVPGVEKRVIRGGNPGSDKNAGVTLRRAYPARGPFIYQTTGFRCAKDVN